MAASASPPYEKSVFINCHFDPAWKTNFYAIVFTVHACRFQPRCSWERSNTDDVRIEKIMEIIEQCQYGIHDVSKENARLNMPLELGLFIGCKRYGAGKKQRSKRYLVFEGKQHSLKTSLSDLGGQDVMTHENDVLNLIRGVRDWLDDQVVKDAAFVEIPHAPYLKEQFDQFHTALPALCAKLRWTPDNLKFKEYAGLAAGWVNANIYARP